MGEQNQKLEKMIESMKNQPKEERRLDFNSLFQNIELSVQDIQNKITSPQRNLHDQQKAKAEILNNLMSIAKFSSDDTSKDLSSYKKKLIDQLSNVEYNMMEIQSRRLNLKEESPSSASQPRSLEDL